LPQIQLRQKAILREQITGAALVKDVDIQRGRRIFQCSQDWAWKLEQVHNLSDASPRKTFAFGNARFGQAAFRLDFLPPTAR